MEKQKKIRILPGGPYHITDGIPLAQDKIVVGEKGASLGWEPCAETDISKQSYTLCRCGHSKNKPFCDGTHTEIGFEGEETARHGGYRENAVCYEGPVVDILDDESLCASLRFCTVGLSAWDAAEQSDVAANRQLAEEQCANCSSGRLTIVEKDGTPIEPDLPQEISLTEDTAVGWDGPLWVKGGIPVEGADGQMYEVRNRVTLCRCGESRNMPFCDTSHLRCLHMKKEDK